MSKFASLLQKYYSQIGWLVAAVFSITFPPYAAPQGTVIPFQYVGVACLLGGFLLGNRNSGETPRPWLSGSRLIIWSLIAFVISFSIYFIMLYLIPTPNVLIELVEVVFYGLTSASLGILIAFGYRGGADFIIDKFGD